MSVLINFKICDNAKECSGIAVCPTGALSWDEGQKTIVIDNTKCISCGKCVGPCPVQAIRVARTDEEYQRIKKEFDIDPRKISDLFVDRYGASPVDEACLLPAGKFNLEVLGSDKLVAVEFFNDDSIQCLRYSIPIKELFAGVDLKYRRFQARDDVLMKEFKVGKLPSLLFFKNGKLLGKIEGYFYQKDKRELVRKIKQILTG